MNKKYQVLAVDDKHEGAKYWLDALEESDCSLTRCRTSEEAVRYFNASHYDLIILDHFIPHGDIFCRENSNLPEKTGNLLYEYLRTRKHLTDVPVIFLTNFGFNEKIRSLPQKDSKAHIIPKRTMPSEFVLIVRNVLHQNSSKRFAPVIPLDEYPNVAPYFVEDIQANKYIRVYFEPCVFGEAERIFAALPESSWEFSEIFAQHLYSETTCRLILKMLSHNSKDGQIIGLYYTGEGWETPKEIPGVLFESAFCNKYGTPNRVLKGVGKAMATRFLREYLYRNKVIGEDIVFNTALLDPKTQIGSTAMKAIPFLETLGFRRDPKNIRELRINLSDAQCLLNKVSPSNGIAPCHR